jgi:glycosyltransferase involved in cell wall biosynthesis
LRVLFISFFFPPIKAIATTRTYNISKSLLNAGHEVHVVTVDDRQMSDSDLETVPGFDEFIACRSLSLTKVRTTWPELYGGKPAQPRGPSGQWVMAQLRRLVFISLNLIGFDPMLPWAFNAWRTIKEMADLDLVLVSGGPFSSFVPAALLAKRLGVPLVLDYRDVWNGTPHGRIRLSLRTLERRLIRQAGAVISVSPSCLASILGGMRRPGFVVTNGVSENVYQYQEFHSQPSEPFIVYAGAFYPPKRSIDSFFAAFSLLQRKRKNKASIRFTYLGPSVDHVLTAAKAYRVEDLVDCIGIVPLDVSLKLQAQSLCTLVVATIDKYAVGADRGILTGKIFEAIELARNVLIISAENSDVRDVARAIPYAQCFTGNQAEAMATWLDDIADAPSLPVATRLNCFSWRILSASFVHVIESLNG